MSLVLAILERAGIALKHLDVTTAFLEMLVNKELYVTLLKGVVLLKGPLRVGSGIQVPARLLKSLYSLKQVSLSWFEKLDAFLSSICLQKLRSELEIYVLRGANNQARNPVLAWIDDIICFAHDDGNDDGDIERSLKQHFRIKTIEDIDYFVKMKIQKSISGSGSASLHFGEVGYIQKILEQFGIDNSRPVATSIEKQTLRRRRPDDLTVNQLEYKQAFGSLHYEATISQSDISSVT